MKNRARIKKEFPVNSKQESTEHMGLYLSYTFVTEDMVYMDFKTLIRYRPPFRP